MNKIRKPHEGEMWPKSIYLLTLCRDTRGNAVAWGWAEYGQTPGLGVRVGGLPSPDSAPLLYRFLDLPSLKDSLIIADSAYSTLVAVGFWQWVKEYSLVLKGTDDRKPSSPRCIVEDPPTIIHYGVRGKPGAAVICDPRNWGWAIREETNDLTAVDFVSENDWPKLCGSLWTRLSEMSEAVKAYGKILRECHLGESWRMTAGSQASYGFRLNYMDSPIEASRADESEALIGKCSYGGRCECFFLGELPGPVYQYDVNQLYSYIAAISPLPVECLGEYAWDEMTTGNSRPWDIAADVVLRTPAAIYPFRAGTESVGNGNQSVIYPIGEFRTFLAGPELELAINCGHLRKLYKAYRYRCERPLQYWANHLWVMRKAACPRDAKIIKAISLSLYGKFGQRLREWHLDNDEMSPPGIDVGDWYSAAPKGGVRRHRVLCGQCSTEVVGDYSPQSSPPIAAWICSAARLHLQRLINSAGGAFYVDTDSLWVDRKGSERLQASGWIGESLGGLRLVGEWEWVKFHGIKHYEAEGTVSQAGVPDGAESTGLRSFQWKEQCTFNGHMKSREWPSRKIVVKSYRGQSLYTHGVPQPDGRVMPHHLTLDVGE